MIGIIEPGEQIHLMIQALPATTTIEATMMPMTANQQMGLMRQKIIRMGIETVVETQDLSKEVRRSTEHENHKTTT